MQKQPCPKHSGELSQLIAISQPHDIELSPVTIVTISSAFDKIKEKETKNTNPL
jgi:hypothetical protein